MSLVLYVALAGAIVAALVAGALGAPLLLVESVAVLAFAAGWLLKGRILGRQAP